MALLERAHASVGMGHFLLDPKRMTIEFSSWVRENIGLNDMPIPLDRLPEIVVEEEREAFNRQVAELLESQEGFSFETVVMTAAGKARRQRISGITAFENERSREGLIGFFGILQEITQEKRSQDELRAARDTLQAELDSRTNLLAVVSHEIRTPLSGILGVIDQLKRERSAQEREKALTLIEDSSEVLLDTLDAILQQARIGEDRGNLASKRFRPVAIAHRVAELFRPLARRKGLRIDVRGPADAYAIGDPARLQQLISNFVSNGVKFTQTGRVSIEVTPPLGPQDQWRFEVSDTGAGMDKARIEEIFQPFGSSSEDSLGRAVGAGLGLSITQELIASMGGTIEVESDLGRGSIFAANIPFKHTENEDETENSALTRGSVALLIERASDRVQAEATASTHGFELIEFEGEPSEVSSHSAPILLVADRAKLEGLSGTVLAQFDRVVAITSDGDGSPSPVKLPDEIDIPLSIVPNMHIARALGKIITEDTDDAA